MELSAGGFSRPRRWEVDGERAGDPGRRIGGTVLTRVARWGIVPPGYAARYRRSRPTSVQTLLSAPPCRRLGRSIERAGDAEASPQGAKPHPRSWPGMDSVPPVATSRMRETLRLPPASRDGARAAERARAAVRVGLGDRPDARARHGRRSRGRRWLVPRAADVGPGGHLAARHRLSLEFGGIVQEEWRSG